MSKSQPIHLVLLPGMDGTGRLFRPLLNAFPAHIEGTVVSYPTDARATYAEAETFAFGALPRNGEFALLGESYSGPIALRIAARRPAGLRAVVLAVSFAQSPATTAVKVLSLLGRPVLGIPPPAWLVRKFLLGPAAPKELVSEFKQVVSSVRSEVLAARLKDLIAVDVREELRCCACPLLCLAASNDRLVPPRIYQSMRALRPDMEFSVVEGPHCLLQRNPVPVAHRIAEFLRRASSDHGTRS